MKNRYLVTPALPYANGAVHLGHLLEHIQVNIFVRALRMAGQEVLYVCGADSHGTPIEMNAKKAGMEPQDFVEKFRIAQEKTFKRFGVEFDGGYGTTHSDTNEHHAQMIFKALTDRGVVSTREIEQLYDPELNRFLPDRMVRGTCPFCKTTDQYGDSCESCGRTYSPTDLIDPKSALSGHTPVLKKSQHYFVSLASFESELRAWINDPQILNRETKAYLENWFKDGLRDWDISRDGPYFGFLIPGETDKYFYVWLDAPIGYISLTELAAKERGQSFQDYWCTSDTKIVHFIGKDIVYFHTLFWPAMLMAAKYTLPHRVYVHGMLTINGEKMSKSRGSFILADSFADAVNPESLRYYFACKLSKRTEDIDLNLSDFVQRVNTDLVNKIVNLISRSLPLLHRSFEGRATKLDENAKALLEQASACVSSVKNLYLDNEPSLALGEIMRLAEEGNRYLQDQAPWQRVKENSDHAHEIMTTGLYIGKICLGLLKPVLPDMVRNLEEIISEQLSFDTIATPFVVGHQFKPYHHLVTRIEEASVQELINPPPPPTSPPQKPVASGLTPIDIQRFLDVELRAAKIISAQDVAGSDKLIECRLDLGELGQRTVFSGLRPHYFAHNIEGKMVVVVANLAPRKMRFGTSEGMILAVGDNPPVLLTIEGTTAGARVG